MLLDFGDTRAFQGTVSRAQWHPCPEFEGSALSPGLKEPAHVHENASGLRKSLTGRMLLPPDSASARAAAAAIAEETTREVT